MIRESHRATTTPYRSATAQNRKTSRPIEPKMKVDRLEFRGGKNCRVSDLVARGAKNMILFLVWIVDLSDDTGSVRSCQIVRYGRIPLLIRALQQIKALPSCR